VLLPLLRFTFLRCRLRCCWLIPLRCCSTRYRYPLRLLPRCCRLHVGLRWLRLRGCYTFDYDTLPGYLRLRLRYVVALYVVTFCCWFAVICCVLRCCLRWLLVYICCRLRFVVVVCLLLFCCSVTRLLLTLLVGYVGCLLVWFPR